ncbi:MAG: zinc-ribbon domain-containing protein [Clostridiales bacterium]|nr:zinc-ribbon domain-containing protein [Clostridiales bacterium]
MFCTKCGKDNPDDSKFCVACGAALSEPAPDQQPQQNEEAPPQPEQTRIIQNPPEPEQPKQQPGTVANEVVMAVLAYFIFFIPLLAAPEDKFARYHANQGLICVLAAIALGIVRAIFFVIFWGALWRVFSLIFNLAWLGWAALWIMGIINAAQAKTKPVPVIGELFTLIK